jgi:hypothetical protein
MKFWYQTSEIGQSSQSNGRLPTTPMTMPTDHPDRLCSANSQKELPSPRLRGRVDIRVFGECSAFRVRYLQRWQKDLIASFAPLCHSDLAGGGDDAGRVKEMATKVCRDRTIF